MSRSARPSAPVRFPTHISGATAVRSFPSLRRPAFSRAAVSLTAGAALLLSAACGGDRASTDTPAARDGANANPTASTADSSLASSTTLSLGERDVVRADTRPVTSGIPVTGSLDPAERVEIKSQIAGQLDRVLVERGTAVRRGQALAHFESGALRAQLASAEAALAARERDLVAADTLYKRGAASQQDFVNAQVARDAARAQLAQARETLARASITAPIAGQVSEKHVATGEGVQSGARLFTLVNADQLELAGKIAAADAARVRVGQTVQLLLDAYPGRTFVGRVDRLDAVADPATRQVTVYIRYDNTPDARSSRTRVVAGLFASGRIQVAADEAPTAGGATAVTVPSAAVRTEGSDQVVYLVEEGRLRRRVVTLGPRDPDTDRVEVRSGVAAGDLVLVAPGTAPRDNTPVRLTAEVPVSPRTAP